MSSLPFSKRTVPPRYGSAAERLSLPSEPHMHSTANLSFDHAALDHVDRLCAIGRDTSRLAHDLNNQFTSIGGFCELMLDHLPREHPLFDLAQEAGRSCERALQSLRALPTSPPPYSGRHETSALLETLLEIIAEAPFDWPPIETAFPSNDIALPMPAADLTGLIDGVLRLACRHSTSSGRLLISARHEEGRAKIQFLLSSPVGPWNASLEQRLMLMLLTAAADRAGGSLTCSHVAGGEAALKLTLPASFRQPQAVMEPPSRVSVLVVDDDPQYRGVIQALLARQGYQAVEATDGRAALDQLKHHPCDLVLLDIFMPEPDGFETLRRIRAAHPRLPVVVMSGASMEYLHAATLLGASEALSKVDLPESIGGVVRRLTAAAVHAG